eukprot:COSAG02_NODE_5710_length_4103_cov_12.837662_1_plen_111_part_00
MQLLQALKCYRADDNGHKALCPLSRPRNPGIMLDDGAGNKQMVTSGFGLYADATTDLSIQLPVAAYSLDGMERAVARQAKANSTFWTAVSSHQPHDTHDDRHALGALGWR